MKRRSFVKASLLASSFSSLSSIARAEDNALYKKNHREWYELRTYTLKDSRQQQLVEGYWQNAAIPALNRMGSKHVGVFTELKPMGQTKVFVLIPFASVDAFAAMPGKLMQDNGYLQTGAAYLNAPASAPAYERVQSNLLQAFTGMPKMELPPIGDRIFELRRYESSGEAAGKKKIDMFNAQGEIDIFKRVGLTPVFFGETIIGEMMPNLTYMLTFNDMAEHDANWKAFGGDAEWKRIKAIPGYEDANIVSRITRTFLQPAAYSQV